MAIALDLQPHRVPHAPLLRVGLLTFPALAFI
jgi:hypothetical protein